MSSPRRKRYGSKKAGYKGKEICFREVGKTVRREKICFREKAGQGEIQLIVGEKSSCRDKKIPGKENQNQEDSAREEGGR